MNTTGTDRGHNGNQNEAVFRALIRVFKKLRLGSHGSSFYKKILSLPPVSILKEMKGLLGNIGHCHTHGDKNGVAREVAKLWLCTLVLLARHNPPLNHRERVRERELPARPEPEDILRVITEVLDNPNEPRNEQPMGQGNNHESEGVDLLLLLSLFLLVFSGFDVKSLLADLAREGFSQSHRSPGESACQEDTDRGR